MFGEKRKKGRGLPGLITRLSAPFLVAGMLCSAGTKAQDTAADKAIDKPSDRPAERPSDKPVDKVALAATSSKPVIVVNAFTAASGVSWPYEMKDLQRQTVAEMASKSATAYEVVPAAPESASGHVYTLNGEVLAWHPGNRAKRMLVGMGSGRETADIHYWLTDETGKKVFDNKDTIRAEFWGNAYAGSVGELAHPFAAKISGRIKDAKLK